MTLQIGKKYKMAGLLAPLLLTVTVTSAQMLADFETPETSPPITAEGAAHVVANPDKGGINPSDSVGTYEKTEGNWKYVTLHFPDTVKIYHNNTLTFKLRATTQGRIFAKFYLGNSVVIEHWAPEWNFQPAPNTWTECTMDMTEAMGKAFTRLQFAACVDNEAAADVWFDDVKLSNPEAGDGIPVLEFSVSDLNTTPGEEITLDASGSYDVDGEIVEYLWDLGDGNSASGAVVNHAYNADSAFTVSVTITDNEGKSRSGTERIFVVDPVNGISQPLLITPDPKTNEKIEAIFQLSGDYANMYDPDEVKVDAVITFPGGDSAVLPCFYFVPVELLDGNRTADPVHGSWMLRFSSPQEGIHQVKLILEDGTGSRSPGTCEVPVGEGPSRGIIRRDQENPQYYRHSTGEPFYPLGINIGWDSLEDYKKILKSLSDGKANTFRYWHASFNWQSLEWDENYYYNYEGLGRYNQEAAAMTDSLLTMSEALDMHMQLVIFQHGMFSENVNAMWDTNPYNIDNGGYVERAEAFFYNDDCKAQVKKLLRYIVARWAYSGNLFAWEFFNEVQFTGMHNSQSDLWFPGVVSWHSEMSRYVTSIDPYDHLQTTSAANNHLAYLDTITTMDNLQYHIYEEESKLLNEQVSLDRRFLHDLDHTSIINGEYGTDNEADTPADMQRHALWSGIMTQVPRYMWVWEHYKDAAWGRIFTPPATYLEGEDLAGNGGPEQYDFTAKHSARNLRALGISGDTAFYGYVYDPGNARDITGATITLDSLPIARYTFHCYEAILGKLIGSDTMDLIRGTHTLDLPEFSKGVAFKLKFHAGYDNPLANAGADTVVEVGTPAFLSGVLSSSPHSGELTYQWTLEEKPEGSGAGLDDATAMEPSMTPDVAGSYRISLVVNDGQHSSEPDEVTVRGSLPPVAMAGPDTTVLVTETYVRLNGSASYDPDEDELSYSWVLLSAPEASQQIVYRTGV